METNSKSVGAPPAFDGEFIAALDSLLAWRRDVRRFQTRPLRDEVWQELIQIASLSPSVGNSQPWRWVHVKSALARQAIRENFERCNQEALASYSGERARVYAQLKLAGLSEAPVHLAVFSDRGTMAGFDLGRRTMEETLDYSVVAAITTFWVSARARGIGVGWVSILDPQVVKSALSVDPSWKLIAYLCVGYPVEEHKDPELVRFGWQHRSKRAAHVWVR